MSSNTLSSKSSIFLQPSLSVAVGSTNPCKVEAVRSAIQSIITSFSSETNLILHPYSVPSGVSDQPYSDSETKEGASNRAVSASLAASQAGVKVDLSIGLEGGIIDDFSPPSQPALSGPPDRSPMWCMAWMCCYEPAEEKTSFARTAMFPLPPLMAHLVRAGIELGDADDIVTNRVNSKQGGGTVGVLTNNLVTRSLYYEQAVVLALVSYINNEVYDTSFEDVKEHDKVQEMLLHTT
ncbi:hypothetical protein TrCOL_g407 [Triparma columacea]|uniref:inosine/xanthosine triphosphatase n=1 Tax=Triparma columacea TaxID=722753 RepID=A0A9W7LCS4_9STRA|nr:hypothetical protein TrCOL_g407 [Triparma columacea]